MINPEILGVPEKLNKLEVEGKPAYSKVFHDLTAVIDSLGLCVFTTFGPGLDDYVDMYNAICGEIYTGETLLQAGDRIWTLEKIFNLKAGIESSEDTLPDRLLNEPIPNGPSKGHTHRLDEMLSKYYEVRGWDEDGILLDDTLKALGLEEYIGNILSKNK